jgi:hypothetical protein
MLAGERPTKKAKIAVTPSVEAERKEIKELDGKRRAASKGNVSPLTVQQAQHLQELEVKHAVWNNRNEREEIKELEGRKRDGVPLEVHEAQRLQAFKVKHAKYLESEAKKAEGVEMKLLQGKREREVLTAEETLRLEEFKVKKKTKHNEHCAA